MEDVKNPDVALMQRPVTSEELGQYKKFAREQQARVQKRSFAEAQVEGWRTTWDVYCERAAHAGMDSLLFAQEAVPAYLKAYGDFSIALQAAPNHPEILALQEAVERDDATTCIHYPAHDAPLTEFIYSQKHGRIVGISRCERCGFTNTRTA